MIDFPAEFRAGTTLAQRNLLTAYPANDGWVLKVSLRGPAAINLVGTADGVTHVLAADAATTAGWAPGTYAWAATLEDGTDVIDAGGSTLVVVPSVSGITAPYTASTHAERTLELIEAAIEGRIPKDQQSYQIGNRQLVRIPIEELMKLRATYRAEVAKERRKRRGFGSIVGQNVRVRF